MRLPAVKATALQHPAKPLVLLPHRRTEPGGPLLGDGLVTMQDSDLTTWHVGEPLRQRIVVSGRVLDSGGRPVPNTLIEIWHTSAADRYQHKRDQTPDADRLELRRRRPCASSCGNS